jgi:hypothetical protein
MKQYVTDRANEIKALVDAYTEQDAHDYAASRIQDVIVKFSKFLIYEKRSTTISSQCSQDRFGYYMGNIYVHISKITYINYYEKKNKFSTKVSIQNANRKHRSTLFR